MNFFLDILLESWHLLLESSVFILFGLVVSGLLRVFLDPGTVSRHLGQGRFRSVFKASILGIPIPLCSCGVLPAAATLRKQGANKGAVTSFLISTPESGVDSVAITYALMDPIMTVVRPVAAFLTAFAAGISENLLGKPQENRPVVPDLTCPVDGCCDGRNCSPEAHRKHHTTTEKIGAGLRFAFTDVWGDLAVWFLFGLLLSGVITQIIPESIFSRYMGGGLFAMLIMLGGRHSHLHLRYGIHTRGGSIDPARRQPRRRPGFSHDRPGHQHHFPDGAGPDSGKAGHGHLPFFHCLLRRGVWPAVGLDISVPGDFGPGGGRADRRIDSHGP